MLAAGSRDGTPLLDTATGDVLGRLEAKMGAVVGLAFAPDGKTLLAAGEASKVCVWDVPGRKLRRTLDGRGVGRSLALSPNGKRVALGTAYDAIRLWDVETGKECFTEFDGHNAPVHCVAFTPDGRTLVSGDFNQEIRLWDGATWTQTRLLRGSASTVSFTPDGKRMAAVINKAVRVWDFAAGTTASRLELPDATVIRSALFAADGKTLVSLDARPDPAHPRGVCRLIVWDAAAGRQLRQWTSPETGWWSLALAPDGKSAFVGESMGPIRMYDLETGEEIRTFTGHGHIVSALALSADGRTLLSGCDDRSARLWEVLTGKEIFALAGPGRTVGAVAFSPDGRLAVSAGGSASNRCDDEPAPNKIRLWDVYTGKQAAHFELHTADVLSLAFSADGSRLVSGLSDGTVLVWDVAALPRLPALTARADELDALWQDLAGSDSVKAHQAVWKLTAIPEKALPFLAEHLPPAAEVTPEQLRQLIADLDSDQFAVRAAAVKELERQGDRAAPALREALSGKPSAEVRKRVEELLAGVRQVRSPEVLRRLRAVQVLERAGSPAARRVLETLARGSATARETREAKTSLQRLAGRAATAP
jgi:WD40 repeat protein